MPGRWLLLLHQIPPKPPYFRAKILRRLHQLGAVSIKNSAYVLPASDETLEDFHWLVTQISEENGEAWLFSVDALAGVTDEAIEAAFQTAREQDYKALTDDARHVLDLLETHEPETMPPDVQQKWARLQRRYDGVRRIDFFAAPGRARLEAIMDQIQRTLQGEPPTSPALADVPTQLHDLRGHPWVTRAGIKVDRMASAWFIRRFVDPKAAFFFVPPESGVPADAIRFDMFGGRFTHEGDRCTFEVLFAYSGLEDSALRAIGEIVHDIDLKDAKFERPEALGLSLILDGIMLRHSEDGKRLEEAAAVFDALYANLKAAGSAERS